MKTLSVYVRTFVLLSLCWIHSDVTVAESTELARDRRALLPIVVSPQAGAATKESAAKLAAQLKRITGATFAVESGDGQHGIAVGTIAEFPSIEPKRFDPSQATRREEYLLRSHGHGIWIVGASDLAVRHALWDLLERMGYRQFFPGPKWEIVPSSPNLSIDVDVFESPSYHSRRIWYGFGAWDYAKEPYLDWCEKNRCVQGIELNTGHAYDGILSRNKKEFEAHPEYLGLLDGVRQSTKFCISNPGLRQLCVDDALRQIELDPGRQSVSMDPSDGGNWCECEPCAKLGSVSDRALYLANAVAEGLTAKYPDRFVGIYAYNQHSPPPSIKAHPRVVVSIATAFITGGYTIDELLRGWSEKADILGIREYYSVNTWDRDLPGAARGGQLHYLQQTIPHFHQKSARFLTAESSDNWGPNGLGYYVAAKLLWDVDQVPHIEQLKQDFLAKCFGPAQEPMKKFYELLNGEKRPPLSDDLVGRMYRLLDEAAKLTDDEAVQARLDDLSLYTRYVELWLDYSVQRDNARQAAFERLIRHAYRMRTSMTIHTLALYRDLDARDKAVAIPENARFNVPEGQNPWKDSTPFQRSEIQAIRTAGIATRKLLDFSPVSFSRELVPVNFQSDAWMKPGTVGLYSRAPRTYFTWVNRPPQTFPLEVIAGVIYTNRGATKIDLYPEAEAEGKSVSHVEVQPTRQLEKVSLQSKFSGLHRLEILAGGAATVTWTDGFPMTMESSSERLGGFHGRWSLYFYVPRGSRIVGGFSHGVGTLRDADGQVVWRFEEKPGYFSVAVPADADGKLWKFEHCSGDKSLMTVPPYLARTPEELLVPREVVERDGLSRSGL